MRNKDHYCVTNDAIAAFAKLTREADRFLGFDFEQWLFMEYKGPALRRPYTIEEAEELLGNRIRFELNGHHVQTVTAAQCDGKEVLINGMHQNDLMAWGATIDGQPFGVEVRNGTERKELRNE